MRSGTSVGANINEAQAAQSTKDFIAKMSIASKEARESKYWLDLLVETDFLELEKPYVVSLLEENLEIIKLKIENYSNQSSWSMCHRAKSIW